MPFCQMPNGISFCSTALAGCTSVTDDTTTDYATVTSVAIGSISMPPKKTNKPNNKYLYKSAPMTYYFKCYTKFTE